ncbi:protein of unknown function [Streptomyces sp. KY75]|nr:protein of unknown function [Streptomyces sp. KY70]CAD5986828.1 protein of unknown function [Streptomyces sp. KY75]
MGWERAGGVRGAPVGRRGAAGPGPRVFRSDQAGLAGAGTHICGVVVNHQRSALPQSSALQLHAPAPAP